MRRGLSLLEILVVIAAIGVLMAILLPALSGTRRSANEIKSLANIRTIAQTFDAYIDEHGAYPAASSGWALHPDWAEPPAAIIWRDVWLTDRLWPIVMHDLAPWPENYQSWLSPGADSERFTSLWSGQGYTVTSTGLTSYRYSNSFLARPRVWSGSGGDYDESLIRAARRADVRQPSQKVLLYDTEVAYLTPEQMERNPRRAVGLADGSASIRRDAEAVEPVANPLRSGYTPRMYHDTPNGTHGVDVR
ncbi:MAG: type II secretion system protein [Phycisphaerales bacterium]|nr:type II secretion system protein [Phycisphaerales bacterium]